LLKYITVKTKPFIYLLIFSFFFLASRAQSYDTLVVENAQWTVMFDDDFTPWIDGMSGWLLRGDTIIDSLHYKKLYQRVFEEPNSNIVISQDLFGCLREDVEGKKVYAIDFLPGWIGCDTLNNEYLLFDFSLPVGDTTTMCILTENLNDPVLTEIYRDNVFGKERNIHDFGMESSDFIEGVGHFQGLMESPIFLVSRLVFTELVDYCRGTDEECGVIYVGMGENSFENSFSIHPNPVSGNVNIHFIDKQDVRSCSKIILNDTFGRCVLAIDNPSQDLKIDVSDFADGLYFIGVFSGKNYYDTKKLIISR